MSLSIHMSNGQTVQEYIDEQVNQKLDDRLEECMANIKRQAEVISEQARENIILRFKVDELTIKVAQLSGLF